MGLVLSNSTGSALMGQPPNTQDDWYIIRGLYRAAKIYTADPSKGYLAAPPRPEGAVHESKRPQIVVGMVIVILAIMLPTVLRLGLRAFKTQMKFGSDDWAIAFAASIAVLYPVLQIVMVFQGGGGIHTWEVSYVQYNLFSYYGVVCKTVFYVAVGLVKVSITLFIRRLADRSSRKWTIFCDFFLFTLAVYLGLAIFWTIFLCIPAPATFDKHYLGGLETLPRCGSPVENARVLSIMHVVQGMVLLASPIAILWEIRMNRAKKIRLFMIWGVGGITVLGGLLRQIRQNYNRDFMWDYTEILVWTTLDLSLGVIVASLPVMDAFIAEAWRTVTTTGSKSNSQQGSRWPTGQGTGNVKSTASATPRQYSDSLENIIRVEDQIELRYSTRRDSESDGGTSDHHSGKHTHVVQPHAV